MKNTVAEKSKEAETGRIAVSAVKTAAAGSCKLVVAVLVAAQSCSSVAAEIVVPRMTVSRVEGWHIASLFAVHTKMYLGWSVGDSKPGWFVMTGFEFANVLRSAFESLEEGAGGDWERQQWLRRPCWATQIARSSAVKRCSPGRY